MVPLLPLARIHDIACRTKIERQRRGRSRGACKHATRAFGPGSSSSAILPQPTKTAGAASHRTVSFELGFAKPTNSYRLGLDFCGCTQGHSSTAKSIAYEAVVTCGVRLWLASAQIQSAGPTFVICTRAVSSRFRRQRKKSMETVMNLTGLPEPLRSCGIFGFAADVCSTWKLNATGQRAISRFVIMEMALHY